MTKRWNYDTREWFLETVTFERLWRQWTKRPADGEALSAVVESLERLGVSQLKRTADFHSMEQER
jgi:hypothetical protein